MIERIKLNAAQLKALKSSKILFSYDVAGPPWIEDGIAAMPASNIFAEDFALYPVPTPFYSIGAFSYAGSRLPRFVQLGRYCSIATQVEVLPNSHPTDLFTTSPMVYDPRLAGRVRFYADEGYENIDVVKGLGHPSNERPIVIGNDVYIATAAKLRAGITIGNGAIVAAYSVVTRPVSAYSVVAGNPARVVRMRYSEKQIEQLEKLEWWNWDFRSILRDTNIRDIDVFVEKLSELINAGKIKAFQPGRNSLIELLSIT